MNRIRRTIESLLGNERTASPEFLLMRCVLTAVFILILIFALWRSPLGRRIDRVFSGKIIDRYHRHKIDMSALNGALEAYQAYYGRFPLTSNISGNEANNASLIEILTAKTNNVEVLRQNPNGRKFLEVSEASLTNGAMVDPWGRSYHIAFGVGATNHLKIGNEGASATIAIWSDGPNGINEYGKGDDVRSWK
jgi:hypothetical protein